MRCVFAPQQNEALAIRLSLSSPLAHVRLSSVCNLGVARTSNIISRDGPAQREDSREKNEIQQKNSHLVPFFRLHFAAFKDDILPPDLKTENEMTRQQ